MELAEHATKVMHTLDEGIKGLGDVDAFFEYIHQVGASHRRIPGFKSENFWVSKYSDIIKIESGRSSVVRIQSYISLKLIEFILLTKSFFLNSKETGVIVKSWSTV